MTPKKGDNIVAQKGAESQDAEGKTASSNLETLEEKVTRLEGLVKDSRERIDVVDSRFEEQDNKRNHLKGEMEELLTDLFKKLGNRGDALEAELEAAKFEIEEMKADMALLKVALKMEQHPLRSSTGRTSQS
ncbi:hypothetical protein HRI_004500300 [Hibiscus trionum]|uniref:Uncharacterized protein n=1 Tax=Hibiscus trionum TaxID=183268 RepID=A0A9W7J5G5_HIBTR|nr:hypothetical protein HRI_004500300 [Hibiscus trionum]